MDALRDWIIARWPSKDSGSPMEELFYAAWMLLTPGQVGLPAFSLKQQGHVGVYRADFLYRLHDKDGKLVELVVEIDGHDFHERTKAQAAHDKARDRWMTGNGYSVIRFTGSEVYANPFRCADDVAARIYMLHYGESRGRSRARAGLEAIRKMLES